MCNLVEKLTVFQEDVKLHALAAMFLGCNTSGNEDLSHVCLYTVPSPSTTSDLTNGSRPPHKVKHKAVDLVARQQQQDDSFDSFDSD